MWTDPGKDTGANNKTIKIDSDGHPVTFFLDQRKRFKTQNNPGATGGWNEEAKTQEVAYS